jgi:hypothetical protein
MPAEITFDTLVFKEQLRKNSANENDSILGTMPPPGTISEMFSHKSVP